ncbi:ubiquitin 3 binding protein But2 C-terminal domain-containing protein [Xylaria palmicola]|nr:ubiquitin 3 binding protein But2 C-terminal domain-containing protein [Xylaria palmicola]
MLQRSTVFSSLVGAGAALTMRQSGCSFHIRTEGSLSAPVGQFGTGQTRAGPDEAPAGFAADGDTVTDAQGRGCWWTPPAMVLQCDVGQVPEAGFAIGCDGALSFGGQITFYQCETGADGVSMIYREANGSQCGEVTLHADGCYPSSCNGAAPPANASTSTGTGTLPLGGLTTYYDLSSTATAPGTTSTGNSNTLPLGGLTSYYDLSSTATAPGTTSTGNPGTLPPGTPGADTGTDTLPLGGLTSYWGLVGSLPTNTPTGDAGSTYPGAPPNSASTPPGDAGSTYPGTPPSSESTPPAGTGSTYPGAPPSSESTPPAGTGSAPPGTGNPQPSTPSTPSPTGGAPGGGSCPGELTGAWEFPHLIIPVDSADAGRAPGTSYFGEVTSTVSSAFSFDVPSGDAGKTCDLVFYFPRQDQLETSSFTFAGSGAVAVARLEGPVSRDTSYASLPAAAETYPQLTVAPGHAYAVASFPCPAGQSVAFRLSAAPGDDSTSLRYFQDYNPCPIGMFINVS